MESAEKNLQLISPDIESSQKAVESGVSGKEPQRSSSKAEKIEISQISGETKGAAEHRPGAVVSKSHLINKLNFLNFQDDTLFVNFKHRKYNKKVTLLAKPQPCMGDSLVCVWSRQADYERLNQFYEFDNLLLPDGNKLLLIEPELKKIDREGLNLLLPETCSEVSSRATMRHRCTDVAVQFIQHSSIFSGKLLDFNACSLRVELRAKPPQTFDWINPKSPVNMILSNDHDTLFAEECRIIRQTSGQHARTYILEPLKYEIQRFKHKEYRSQRCKLTPSPNIVFKHPFTSKIFNLKIIDLSGSGFSVEEDENNAVLMPGIILPELELSFTSSLKIKCRAQVVYRKVLEEKKNGKWVKCGLALLDIDTQDHVKLISLLHQTKDRDSYICNKVNMDDLWDFFFETGFIYPDKYAFIEKNKNEIKRTYEKLYTRSPHIARHFIYQIKGRIMGHMAMIRFYKKTWLIHHHAARKSALNKAGLVVLDQIGRLGNESHQLLSLHMDYLMCYYRPENKFPSRVFGGAARSINNKKGCSIDPFAYFHHRRKTNLIETLPKPWELTETFPEDIQELENFYQHDSDGVMTDALDLRPDKLGIDNLTSEYSQLGLKRGRHLFSLRKDGVLKAITMVNEADLGLNLSDLTNCIQIFVIDPDDLPKDILRQAISKLSQVFEHNDIPVLLYPMAYAEKQNIDYEKQYNLWIINLQYTDPYFRYLNRLLRFV